MRSHTACSYKLMLSTHMRICACVRASVRMRICACVHMPYSSSGANIGIPAATVSTVESWSRSQSKPRDHRDLRLVPTRSHRVRKVERGGLTGIAKMLHTISHSFTQYHTLSHRSTQNHTLGPDFTPVLLLDPHLLTRESHTHTSCTAGPILFIPILSS